MSLFRMPKILWSRYYNSSLYELVFSQSNRLFWFTFLLNKIESGANFSNMTSRLDLLSLRSAVDSLFSAIVITLVYLSRVLAACLHQPIGTTCNTFASNNISVVVGKARVGRCNVCFFPCTAKLANCLLFHVSLNNYVLSTFKKDKFFTFSKTLISLFLFFPLFPNSCFLLLFFS